MRTCEDHSGAVVVYDGQICPVCDTISDMDSSIESYKDDVASLEKKLEDAENELANSKE